MQQLVVAVQKGNHSAENGEEVSLLLSRLVKSSNNESIKKIFDALDLNGDGQISWWEWKNVLSSAIASDSSFIDTMDPLLLQIKAAADALLYFKKHDNADDERLQLLQATQTINDSGSNSKLLSNLQSTVRSLRETNNILSLRYENALLDTTQVEIRPDVPSDETAVLESRLRDAESQSAAHYDAFLKTKKKLDEISTFGAEPSFFKKSSDRLFTSVAYLR